MRAVIQRVKRASVSVEEEIIGKIDSGILLFLAVGNGDTTDDADYLLEKIINLRIFEDSEGKLNLSAKDLNKEILIVSQFTLYGDCRKGRRPSFSSAASPGTAFKMYDYFIEQANKTSLKIETGEFQAMMEIDILNHGPLTLMLDSNKEF
ncbi:D-aminoacyl-tRNA deacylase [Natronospora cellulosivora (SeqCode)]